MPNVQPDDIATPPPAHASSASAAAPLRRIIDGSLWFLPVALWLLRESGGDPLWIQRASVGLALAACSYLVIAKLRWPLVAKLALLAVGAGAIAATPAIDPLRLYPFLASATFLGLFISARLNGDNILYSLSASFIGKVLPPSQMRALQGSLDVWIAALVINTAVLGVLLVRYSFATWVLYAQVYSYVLLAAAMVITVLKVALASPVTAGGTTLWQRLWAVTSQALGFALFGILGLLGMVLLALLRPIGLFAPQTLEKIAQKFVHFGFSFAVTYWQAIGLMDLKVFHPERGHQGSLLIANHLSMADVLTIISLQPRCYTFANAKYLRYAHLRSLITYAGYIPVDPMRLDSRVAALEQARQLLRAGKKLVIFPEGTRSLDGSLGKWQRGIFQLALEEGIDITPVFFTTDKPLLNPKSWFYFAAKPIQMHIHFMPPIAVAPFARAEGSLRQRSSLLAQHCREQFLAWGRTDWCLPWNKRP